MKTIKYFIIATINALLPKQYQKNYNEFYINNERLFMTAQHSVKLIKINK